MPTFDNYQPDELPVFTDKSVWMRLIAGQAFGLQNGVNTHHCSTPISFCNPVLASAYPKIMLSGALT
ncbi:hypothetical protein [Spirosoma fluminis]